MRVAFVLCLWAAAAAAAPQPDAEDLPPVDDMADRIISHEISPEEVVQLSPEMPPQYRQDLKNRLPEEERQRIADVVRHMTPQPPAAPEAHAADHAHHAEEDARHAAEDARHAAEDERHAEEHEEAAQPRTAELTDRDLGGAADDYDYEDNYDYEEEAHDHDADEDPPAEPVEEEPVEENPAPGAEPAGLQEPTEPVLRAPPVFRAELEAREDVGPAVHGGGLVREGGGGSSEGGVVPVPHPGKMIDDREALQLLLFYSRREAQVCLARYQQRYNFYAKDPSKGPSKVQAEVEYLRLWREFAESSSNMDLSELDRPDLLLLFNVLRHDGVSKLSDQDLQRLVEALTNLETQFARAQICDYHETSKCDLKLYRDIRVKLASSTDPNELEHYWTAWRDELARNSPRHYSEFVGLLDQAAKLKNPEWKAWNLLTYPYDRSAQPGGGILTLLERVWEKEIAPMYEQLHTYARYRLRQRYGSELVPARGPIPAHLFGSLEADDWTPLEELMRPFTNSSSLHFHRLCADKNVDVGLLKQVASRLYYDLGLNRTDVSDLTLSKLNVAEPGTENTLFLPRVLDRCFDTTNRHYSVGIYPTNTTLSDYIELIELFGSMQKYNERAGSQHFRLAFPYKDRLGFSDYGLDLAIGGARALSALSPSGLKSLLELELYDISESAMINYQMAHMLKLLPRLAASMAAVRWQAAVMNGDIEPEDYNDKWWEYKREYQGVSPPSEREDDRFDPFADGTITLPSYHLRRLVGGFAMFNIHKFQCRMTDSSTPLAECAIFNSQDFGNKIRETMLWGNAKSFRDQLEKLTGQGELSASAMVEQLQPTTEWIVEFNKESGANDMDENSQMIAIIVGVVIAVIILGLVVFFIVARRKQRYQDYKGAPTRDAASQNPQNA